MGSCSLQRERAGEEPAREHVAVPEAGKESAAAKEPEKGPTQRFIATAYTLRGKTASGEHTRKGIVAADPDVLPLGSRIRVTGAGSHSGVYVVADTGKAIQGRKIDLWMESTAEARRFGERAVQVEILELAGKGKS